MGPSDKLTLDMWWWPGTAVCMTCQMVHDRGLLGRMWRRRVWYEIGANTEVRCVNPGVKDHCMHSLRKKFRRKSMVSLVLADHVQPSPSAPSISQVVLNVKNIAAMYPLLPDAMRSVQNSIMRRPIQHFQTKYRRDKDSQERGRNVHLMCISIPVYIKTRYNACNKTTTTCAGCAKKEDYVH